MCNYIFSTHMVSMHHREEIRVITVTFKYTLNIWNILSFVPQKKCISRAYQGLKNVHFTFRVHSRWAEGDSRRRGILKYKFQTMS